MWQHKLRVINRALFAMTLAAGFAGCTVGSSAWLYPQSHFDYPNSNVIPLGAARGEASTTTIFIPVQMDGDLKQEAIQNALQAKGGDILVDFVQTTKVVQVPFLPIYTATITVEGTAAKMEIGKQILH